MKILTRMGDNSNVEFTRDELRQEFIDGSEFAAKKAKVPELTQDELDHLLDIYASAARFTAVDIGEEVVLSNDGTGTKHIGNRVQDLQSYETLLGVDMPELWQADYSYKAVKTNVAHEGQSMKIAQALLTNARLESEVRDLKEGQEMIEERARAELGMVKPNEIYVQVAKDPASSPKP